MNLSLDFGNLNPCFFCCFGWFLTFFFKGLHQLPPTESRSSGRPVEQLVESTERLLRRLLYWRSVAELRESFGLGEVRSLEVGWLGGWGGGVFLQSVFWMGGLEASCSFLKYEAYKFYGSDGKAHLVETSWVRNHPRSIGH